MDAFATPTSTERRALEKRSATFAVLAGAALAAIVIQSFWIPIDADVSWLITVSERILGGDRLYIDILEVNPPASVWLYMPIVWLAHIVGLRPEAAIVAAFIGASIGSVIATLRLASPLDSAPQGSWFAPWLAFITLVLPMALFAQREHAALLLAMPAITTVALLAEGKQLPRSILYASGIAAGLVIVIKPPFLFAIGAPALWAAWKRRSLKPFWPSIVAASMVAILYGVSVALLTPAYFDVLRLIALTYAPMHNLLWKVIVGPTIFPAICLALAVLLRPRRVPPLATAWALGSAGFVLAAILQAKNYPNHWLPGTGLAVAALAVVMAAAGGDRLRRAAVGAALATLVAGAMYQWTIRPDERLEAEALRVAPPNPSVIALSPQLVTGHPLTRNIDGRWVGSRAALFTAAGARFVGLAHPAARAAYREDIDSFATDIKLHSPDVILVDRPSKRWLMREPVVVQALSGYKPSVSAGDTEIWLRKAPR